MVKGRTTKNVGHYNNKLVSQLLLDNAFSGIEISRQVKLSHTALSLIIARLLEMDLICLAENAVNEKRTKGGQHVRYTVNKRRTYFLCINFQHGRESFGVFDLCGGEIYREAISSRIVDKEYLDALIININKRIKAIGIDKKKIACVSIAIPGQINVKTGEIIVSSKVDKEINLKAAFQSEYSYSEITVKNDIVYCCNGSMIKGEYVYENESVLFLYIGGGLSCCLVHNGKIVTNSNGFGGEIGMNSVNKDTRLHEVAEPQNLITWVKNEFSDDTVNIDNLFTRYSDNKIFCEKVEAITTIFGTELQNVVNIVGCSTIVFCGEIVKYPKWFYDKLMKTVSDTNYHNGLLYKFIYSSTNDAMIGQIYLTRLQALDCILKQY